MHDVSCKVGGALRDLRKIAESAKNDRREGSGKISEEWAADDVAAIMAQIGAFNPPWAA